MIKVYIIESERGWGSRIDEIKEFSTKDEAFDFVIKYNNKHNPLLDCAPDWYMYAQVEGDSLGIRRGL
jgi:hypothetical protein